MRRVSLPLLAALALLGAAATPAGAHAGHAGHGEPHLDPAALLPDELITRPVAQAELGSLPAEPESTPLAATAGLPETWCGTETTSDQTVNRPTSDGHHFKLIYAHASDQPNRFASLLDDRLQATVSLVGRYFASQSGGGKAPRWDMGTACGPEFVDVQVVALPDTLASYNNDVNTRFDELTADLDAALGARPQQRNLVVYADAFRTGGIAGEGGFYDSDQVTATAHDSGRLEAITYGRATPTGTYAEPATTVHEMGHTMGAVQLSSPNTSGAGHCLDEQDVMCYAENGRSTTVVCASSAAAIIETYDCGADDYFSVAPAAGSYLATHWNTYRSAHLGACAFEQWRACATDPPLHDGAEPANTTPAAPSGWRAQAYAVTVTGTDAGGNPAAGVEWRIGASGAVSTNAMASVAAHGEQSLQTRVRDGAGTWSPWRAETVRIDRIAPAVSLSCTGVDGRYRCVAEATDEGAGIAAGALRIVVDDVAQTREISSGEAFDVTGPGGLRVTATDGAGRSASSGTVALDAPPPAPAPDAAPTPTAPAPTVPAAAPAPAPPAIAPPVLAAAPPRASASVTLRGPSRFSTAAARSAATFGTGTVTLTAGRATVALRPARLRTGTYRLRACVAGAGCRERTVRLRRAGRPAALRATLAARSATARVTFTLLRRSGGRSRRVAIGVATARLP